MSHPASDAELVRATLAGDGAAYATLAARYRQAAYGIALHRLGDFDRARDAAQEALVKAFTQLSSLREPAKFGPWLCRIATSTALRLRRQRKWEAIGPEAAGSAETQDVAQIQEKQEVRRALATLPEGERLAVILHYVDGYSHAEIASMTEASVSAVKSRIFRARRRLREEMSLVEKTLKEQVLEQFDLQPLEFTVDAALCPQDVARHLELDVTTVYGPAATVTAGGNYLVVGEYQLDTPAVEWMVLANVGRMSGYHEFLSPGRREFSLYGHAREVVAGKEDRLYIRARPREGEDCSILRITLRATEPRDDSGAL